MHTIRRLDTISLRLLDDLNAERGFLIQTGERAVGFDRVGDLRDIAEKDGRAVRERNTGALDFGERFIFSGDAHGEVLRFAEDLAGRDVEVIRTQNAV